MAPVSSKKFMVLMATSKVDLSSFPLMVIFPRVGDNVEPLQFKTRISWESSERALCLSRHSFPQWQNSLHLGHGVHSLLFFGHSHCQCLGFPQLWHLPGFYSLGDLELAVRVVKQPVIEFVS